MQALGGVRDCATSCRVGTTAVFNWAAANKVPPAHHAALWRLAQSRGVSWTPPGFEGVRLLPVDAPHEHDHNVNIAPPDRESSVKLGDAA